MRTISPFVLSVLTESIKTGSICQGQLHCNSVSDIRDNVNYVHTVSVKLKCQVCQCHYDVCIIRVTVLLSETSCSVSIVRDHLCYHFYLSQSVTGVYCLMYNAQSTSTLT